MKSSTISMLLVLTVFTAALLLGAITPPDVKEGTVTSTMESFQPIEKAITENPAVYLHTVPVIIFYNNLRVAIVNYALGITLLVPLAVVFYNGYIVGTFLTTGDAVTNALLLLPHGITELVAIIYSASLGVRVGLEVVKRLLRKESFVKATLISGARGFTYVIILLLISAFIETFITPLVYFGYLSISGQLPTGVVNGLP